MNIIQLQNLVDVAELGSFTEAAKKNHMTIPAISISISQLEEELGVPLFIRSRKGVTPTNEGKKVMKHAISILHSIEKMKIEISLSQNNNCGNIVIVTTPGMVPSIINTTLEYQKIYPCLNIEMIEGDTNLVLKQVKNGHADMGFVSVPTNDQDGDLIWRPIIRDKARLIVSKHSPLSSKNSISGADIQNETVVLYNDPYVRLVAEKLLLDNPTNTIALISNNVESLFQMVIKGNAISIGTDVLVNSLSSITRDKIVMIPISEVPSDSNYIWRVTRKDVEMSEHLEPFTKHLLAIKEE